jgi:hypothetical protein
MGTRSSARVRRLIVTAVLAAGIGAGTTGVALAATGGSARQGTTVNTTSTTPSATSSSSPSGTPGTVAPGTHHCPHMPGSHRASSS